MSRTFSPLLARLAVFASVALLLFPLIAARPVVAQSTSGTLIGQVFDQTAKPIVDAKVTVTNENNGNARATRTDDTGTYTMPFLVPGSYTISASMTGYEGRPVRMGIPLNATTPLRPPDITLHATSTPGATPAQPSSGAAAQQDDITPLINTTDASRRGNFTAKQIEALPLGGTTDMRTFDEFALLLPGVAPPPYTPGVRGPGVGFGIGTAGEFAVNGLRARSNNFTVDGSDNNDPDVGVRRQGFVALVPQSIESIREFQVSTLLWNSEMGRNSGSQVNAVSKEGGKKFHGQAYAFFTDSSLNAKNFFDYLGGASDGKNPFTRTQAGFIITGPIVRDRTQFFGSYEYLKVNASTEQHFATPTLAERRFLGLPVFGVLKYSPNALINEFFGERLGATPVGRNTLSFYPAPNDPGGPYGANTYTEVLPADGRGSILSSKITHRFNDTNTIYARYNFTDDSRVLPSVNRAIRSAVIADTRTQDLSLIFDHEFGPRLFSQARFSYGRTRLGFSPHPDNPFIFAASSLERVIGSQGTSEKIPSATGPIGELVVEPFSPVGVNAFSFPQRRVNNTFQFADSISWALRRHSLKLGADVRRVQLNSLLDRNFRPQVVFGGALLTTGTLRVNRDANNPFTFLPGSKGFLSGLQLATLGLPSSIFQTITAGVPDSTIALRFTEYNFFITDNWRVRSNFTLDYGLRYEYNSVPKEANNRIEDALALKNLPAPGGSRADTPERTAAFNASVEAYRRVLDGRKQIYDPDRNNFGPHVGFAWDPWTDGKTSVRGGYGIFYDAILGAVVSQSRSVFPTEIPVNVEPSFAPFDVFSLNNPSLLVVRDGRGGVTVPDIPLIAEGTLNQFGGSPADFVALIGELFRHNELGGGLAFTLPDKHLRTPYAQQWHLTIEREFLRDYAVSLGYVGTKGTKLTMLTTPNLGPNVTPSVQLATNFVFPVGSPPAFPLVLAECTRFQDNKKCSLQPNRPEPALGAFQVFKNAGSSNYHALQLEARSRYKHGYSFTFAYTWSHSIDDVSDVFPVAGAPTLPQDSFNLRLERANSNFDVRHRVASSLIWDLPFYRDAKSGAMARWFGGWQVASIFQAYTGQPFTLNLPNDANEDGNLTDRPSTTNGLVFFSGHGRQKVAMAAGTDVTDFFVLGRDGFVGRNTVRGDSFVNWDVALSKGFTFTERQKLDFRAEVFNALNRANFGLPIRTLGSPGFGSAVETVNPARIIQFAVKYSF